MALTCSLNGLTLNSFFGLSVQVLKIVMRDLAGTDLSRLPSKSFVSRVISEVRYILNEQLREKINESEEITLSTDAATHNGIHYLGTQLTFKDGSRHTIGRT